MKLRKPCEHAKYDEHNEYYGRNRVMVCPGGVFLPDDTLVIEKVDGEWPEGVEVWWFCKTEGQRRKKYLGCFGGLNCRPDSGCGLRLFVSLEGVE